MNETIHILMHLRDFDNVMYCGNVNTVWVSSYSIDYQGELKNVTCEECRDEYAMMLLGEL